MTSTETSLIVCNLDATRLERSLVFGLQVQGLAQQYKKPILFALNMIDEIARMSHHIDSESLSEVLGSPVIPISAKTRQGIENLKKTIKTITKLPNLYLPKHSVGDEKSIRKLARKVGNQFGIQPEISLRNQNALDHFLLHNSIGGIVFMVVMFLLFQSIFTWAAPLMDAVENGITSLASYISSYLGTGLIADFINDAVFSGIGSFLVFVPQIMVLTFVIGLLEDCGYLARAALICHRPLSYFGLSGRTFIPYLSGHACAIPAIMAARTIESPRKRLITMLTIPLLSCSARLPVYALLVSVFIPEVQYLNGIVSLQGITFFCLYLFGIMTALLVSFMLSRYTKIGKDNVDMPFILELPAYRLPHWKPLINRVMNSGKQFIYRAGPIIFLVSTIVWILGYFPLEPGGLENSYLSKIGHFIEPVFSPLGLDWRYGVAIISSFLAREVFVGTLGTLLGMDGADGDLVGLADKVRSEGMEIGTGIGLLLFYVVALQCVATVAMLRAETGSDKVTLSVVIGYGIFAYFLALLAHILI